MQTWNDVIRLANHPIPSPRRVEKTPAEWRAQLTAEQFHVTREHGTERAFTGEYCEAHEAGLYACVCCGTPLYDSRTKFESGTGWPSFTLAELMHRRRPVGAGPSGKAWPWWASHTLQSTSMRVMP